MYVSAVCAVALCIAAMVSTALSLHTQGGVPELGGGHLLASEMNEFNSSISK